MPGRSIALVGAYYVVGLSTPTGALVAQHPTVAAQGTTAAARSRDELLSRPVTLHLTRVSLKQAVDSIARVANVLVQYQLTSLKKYSEPVSVSAARAPLGIVLERVLDGTTLRVVADGRGNLVLLSSQGADADSLPSVSVVAGSVIDSATGRGLRGVTIKVIGTKRSTMTTDSGKFVMQNVPTGDYVLTMKLFGYRPAERAITVRNDARTTVRVLMVAAPNVLSGVVTTATGVQRRLEVGNDITTLNVDSIIRTAPISSVTDLLESRVPGLTVMRTSGVPGAPSRLRLRGMGGGLLSGQPGAPTNDPIVIVDGIRINASQSGVTDQNLAPTNRGNSYSSDFPPPSAIDQIDPQSIDKIEVFKGPSATALYGSDAANGVIVITTKRGQAGPLHWSMGVNQDIQYFPGTYAAPGYYAFCHYLSGGVQPSLCDLGSQTSTAIDSVVRFQALNESRLTTFGRGAGNEVTATANGGTQVLTYSITGSLGEEKGLLKMPGLYRDLYASVYGSPAPAWMRTPDLYRTRGFSTAIVAEPRRGVRTTFVTRLTSSDQRQSGAQLDLKSLASTYIDTMGLNPTVLAPYATRVNANRFVVDMSLTGNVDFWQTVPLTASVGFSRENRDDDRSTPYGTLTDIGTTQGDYSGGTAINQTQTARLSGTAFPGRKFSVGAGVEVTQQSRQQVQGQNDSTGAGVLLPNTLEFVTQQRSKTGTGGWFLEPRFNLSSRFYFNPGIRIDDNGVAGAGGGTLWAVFPKQSFSWIAIDRSEGTPMFGVISMLRPRLSFGVAGVQPAPGWRLRLMHPAKDNYSLEDSGLELATLGNSQLTPERTRELEGGFDMDLWRNRVSLSVTQFRKLRIDAIEQVGIAPSIYGGSLSQYLNIGRVRNTGTELTLNAVVVERPLVSWTINMSLSKYTNTLLSLSAQTSYIDVGNGTRLVEGYPLFGRWSRPILGYAPSTTGGRLSIADVIIGDTAVYVGQQAPNFELPFSTSLSLFRGRVSVNATFQYKDGLTQVNSGGIAHLSNIYFNPHASLADQAAALVATVPGGGQGTDYGLIQTVNSLRFNTLSVGYSVPQSIAQRLRVAGMQLALQGSNLGLWTNYRGKDPDVNGATVGDVTRDDGQLSQPRVWRFQVRVNN